MVIKRKFLFSVLLRSREEFVNVIEKLKKGEEVGVSAEPNITNEDSNSAEVPLQPPVSSDSFLFKV